MPIAGPLPEPLPILSSADDSCSNRNSVGGGFIEDGKEAHAAGAGQVLGDWGRHHMGTSNLTYEKYLAIENKGLNSQLWKFR
ncbi:hypothetical protein C4D60_Mb08t06510 [Musa balbisiana]|uniref:Uncharacterized protein n=1 Tax=Musa balbisiana TaxID=52838 RepID=A0A4S8K1V3_MUSBA|nr:hypothetical protein C4D60_Mb08t06510 [Musa balbisiana]